MFSNYMSSRFYFCAVISALKRCWVRLYSHLFWRWSNVYLCHLYLRTCSGVKHNLHINFSFYIYNYYLLAHLTQKVGEVFHYLAPVVVCKLLHVNLSLWSLVGMFIEVSSKISLMIWNTQAIQEIQRCEKGRFLFSFVGLLLFNQSWLSPPPPFYIPYNSLYVRYPHIFFYALTVSIPRYRGSYWANTHNFEIVFQFRFR